MLANQNVIIDANTRQLYYNATTNAVVATGTDASSLFGSDIYLLAAFRQSLERVYFCGIDRYKINGAYENPIERHNMYDYVNGQIMVANKYSIPVCNLYEEAGFNYLNKDSFIQADQAHYTTAGYTFISQQTTEFIKKYGGFTNLSGKKIAVFGGSYSVITESQSCKNVWVSQLGVTYTDFGLSGAGFSSLADSRIDLQVDSADNTYDIYLIWCSTNDSTKNAKIGNLATTDLATQTKGMMVTIEKILALKPTAKILLFTSMKAFMYEWMYNPIIDRY